MIAGIVGFVVGTVVMIVLQGAEPEMSYTARAIIALNSALVWYMIVKSTPLP